MLQKCTEANKDINRSEKRTSSTKWVIHSPLFCSMCIILCELVVEEKGKNVLKCSATSGRLETGYTLVVRKGYFSPLFFSPQFRVV